MAPSHPFFNAGAAPKREHPLLSSAKRVAGTYRTALRNLGSGFFNEWDDELTAGVAAPVLAAYDYAKGDGFDVVRRYKEKQAVYDRIKKDDNTAHPIAATVGGVAGGLAQAVAGGAAIKSASAASPAVRSAASSIGRAADAHPLIAGAALGAADAGLAGAGYADPGSRAEGAAANALFGAALGGAGGAIGKYAAEAPYEPNRLNMFIGEKGATKAEKELLKEAQDMADSLAKQGQPQVAIRVLTQKKTGWFKDPVSDKWMMHIPDVDMKMTKEFQEGLESSSPVPMKWTKAYEHPGNGTPLAVRYPNLENVDVYPIGPAAGFTDMTPGYSADYNDDLMRMRIFGDPSEDLNAVVSNTKRLAAHETNHFVQGEEGFTPGASVAQFYMPDMTLKEVTKVAEDMRANPTKWKGESGRPYPPERVEELASWLDGAYRTKRWVWDQHANDQAKEFKRKYGRLPSITQRKEMSGQNTARDLYYSAGGEAMSRATEQNLLDNAKGRQDLIDNVLTRMDEPKPFALQHVPPDILSSPYRYSEQVPEHPFFTQPEPPINRWGKPDINRRGDYMGAPPGINSPEAERALVGRIVDRVNSPEGVAGAGFYDNFSTQVARHTDDREKARVMAYMTAETSPSQSWNNNVNEGVKGFNQYQMGDPVRTGRYPNQTGELIEQNIDRAPGAMPPSDKTGPFGYNLISKDFPMNSDPKRAVFDMHEGRSFGFPEPDHNFTPAEHRYGDRISQMVQEATGLDHKQWQERDWAAIRTRDGLPMSKPQKQLFDESASFTQMEAIPGSTTGATTIRSMPDAAKQQYTDEMFDAAGGNELARMFGLSPELTPGYGKYEGVITPNRKIDVLTATKGSGKNKAIEASSDALMNNVRRMYQFVFGQNASYGTTYRPLTSSESAKNANMAYINLGKQMVGKEGNDTVMAALQRKLGSDWNAKVNPAPYRDGVLIGDISGMKPKQFQKLVNELNGELGGSGVELGRNVGFQMDDIDWSKGEWKQLLEGVRDNPRVRKIFDENVTTILSRVQRKHEALGKAMGFDTNTMLDTVRNIAAKGGYGALMNAVKQGIIPAAAIGFIMAVGTEEGLLGERSS